MGKGRRIADNGDSTNKVEQCEGTRNGGDRSRSGMVEAQGFWEGGGRDLGELNRK